MATTITNREEVKKKVIATIGKFKAWRTCERCEWGFDFTSIDSSKIVIIDVSELSNPSLLFSWSNGDKRTDYYIVCPNCMREFKWWSEYSNDE